MSIKSQLPAKSLADRARRLFGHDVVTFGAFARRLTASSSQVSFQNKMFVQACCRNSYNQTNTCRTYTSSICHVIWNINNCVPILCLLLGFSLGLTFRTFACATTTSTSFLQSEMLVGNVGKAGGRQGPDKVLGLYTFPCAYMRRLIQRTILGGSKVFRYKCSTISNADRIMTKCS